MITNATLTELTPPGPSTKSGGEAWGTAVTLSVRVALTAVSARQRAQLDQQAAEASASLRVLKADLPANVTPARGWRVRAATDGGASKAYRVIEVNDGEKDGGLSNYRLYLKAA